MHEVIIDAHHHFWRSHPILPAPFGPEDLAPELRAAGIDATILVQSADEPAENDRLAEYAQSEFVAGVVAWLPLSHPEMALAELNRMSLDKVCGIRCVIGRDPLEWLNSGESVRLFRQIAGKHLVWDVVPIIQSQTEAVLRLAQTIPELQIAVGHLARPPVEIKGWQPWADNIARLAGVRNVALKVSVGVDVLTSWDCWRAEELLPYMAWAAEQFGAPRLMLASNWPVVLLRGDYQRAWGDLRFVAEHLFPNEPETGLPLGGTAEHWYGLKESRNLR